MLNVFSYINIKFNHHESIIILSLFNLLYHASTPKFKPTPQFLDHTDT